MTKLTMKRVFKQLSELKKQQHSIVWKEILLDCPPLY